MNMLQKLIQQQSTCIMSMFTLVLMSGYQQKVFCNDVVNTISPYIEITNSQVNEGWYNMSAAANSNIDQYFAVWTEQDAFGNLHSLKGQVLYGDATLLGPVIQIPSEVDIPTYNPRVCFDSINNQYLVVWTDARDSYGIIFGQFVGNNGQTIGNSFPISPISTPGDIHFAGSPALAFDPNINKFLIVWIDSPYSGAAANVCCQFINPDGTRSGNMISITNYTEYYLNSAGTPCIAFNSNNSRFLISWINSSTEIEHARLLDESGNFINLEITIGNSIGNGTSLSFDPINARFLHTSIGQGQLINADGSLLGGRFGLFSTIFEGVFGVCYDPQVQKYFAIATSTNSTGLTGTYVDLDGIKRNDDFTIFNANEHLDREDISGSRNAPGFAAGINGKLVVFQDNPHYSSNYMDIYGKIIKSQPILPWTIIATSTSGGSISPNGNVGVLNNGSQTFMIVPDPLFAISDVFVDGSSVGALATYTFTDVVSNHSIYASFYRLPSVFTINSSAGANGSISPSGLIQVNAGQSINFTITPKKGYVVNKVLVDGVSVGSPNSYTFTNVYSNHTITVTFSKPVTYTINATAGANGTINPSGIVRVISGQSQSFTIKPRRGYIIDRVLVDNMPVGAISSYTFVNVVSNHTISAFFRK